MELNKKNKNFDLLRFSKFCGCAAKVSAAELEKILAKLPIQPDKNLLVGFETRDDAGVYRLNPELALVTTVDINTPPVNDPFLFGQIAASNALSDVYAMGGTPITCLNISGFPGELKNEEIVGILAGAIDKINESGAILVGGHTIKNDQLIFGLSVTGIVKPNKYWSNKGAMAGDALILTKPIGCGVLFSANKKKFVSENAFNECLRHVATLNKSASEVMSNFEVHSATDITGFGLIGHVLEMAKASEVTCEINSSTVPVLPQSIEMYEKGINTGITMSNLESAWPHIFMQKKISDSFLKVLMDPQTNGGLLFSVPGPASKEILAALRDAGVTKAEIIGKVKPFEDKSIIIN